MFNLSTPEFEWKIDNVLMNHQNSFKSILTSDSKQVFFYFYNITLLCDLENHSLHILNVDIFNIDMNFENINFKRKMAVELGSSPKTSALIVSASHYCVQMINADKHIVVKIYDRNQQIFESIEENKGKIKTNE